MTDNEVIEIACQHFGYNTENIREIDGRRTIDLIANYVTEIHARYCRRWGFFGRWVWNVDFIYPDLLNMGSRVIIDDATGQVLGQSPPKGTKMF